ncbi:MAG: hypothetical protein ABI367_14105 [Mucilaginibacter sp.]
MKIFIRLCFAVFILMIGASFQKANTLKGTWQFCGGFFNGKRNAAPKEYTLQRKYTAINYEANMLEKGQKPYKYETGNYKLLADTCLETQTFSAQPSKLKGISVHYAYIMRHDTLVLRAKLPNGFVEEDYWKRVK